MLAAIVAGEYEVEAVAGLARGKLRNKVGTLKEALEGRLQPHQRFMLATQLAHIDSLDTLIDEVSGEVEGRLETLQAELKRLSTIPGVSTRISQAMLSEMGADMGRFASAGHLASWVAICPGHDESVGKSRSGRTRKGSPWLRSALVQAAKAAGRTETYLGAQYRRIAARRGANRAAVASGAQHRRDRLLPAEKGRGLLRPRLQLLRRPPA
jgi:transposase